jgi:hypothetical protein
VKSLAALGLLCALLQDKSPVTFAPEPPTETSWPIAGRLTRPNGTVIKITAVRIERRWEATLDKFREFPATERRLIKSAEVDGRSFRANLKNGPTGLYDISITEADQRLTVERHVLGLPVVMLGSTKKSIARITDICGRAAANLEEIQRVLSGKQPGSARERELFIKRVDADEQLVQELMARTDLTGTATLLNEICAHIRNAQVWGLGGGKTTEENNDGEREGGGRDVFLDPKLTFKDLRAQIESVRTVLSREMVLSSASIVDALFARAEGRPDKVLSKAKDFAQDAAAFIATGPVDDKDARAVLESLSGTDASTLAEARKSLQALIAKHRAE